MDYRYFSIQGAGHGAWSAFFNNLVGGKTIDRHCAEFFSRKLGLVEIHPGANTSLFVFVNGPANTVKVPVATDPVFLYQLFSSTDLTSWNPVHPDEIPGDGTPLDLIHSPSGQRAFHRWVIGPGF